MYFFPKYISYFYPVHPRLSPDGSIHPVSFHLSIATLIWHSSSSSDPSSSAFQVLQISAHLHLHTGIVARSLFCFFSNSVLPLQVKISSAISTSVSSRLVRFPNSLREKIAFVPHLLLTSDNSWNVVAVDQFDWFLEKHTSHTHKSNNEPNDILRTEQQYPGSR